MPDPDEVSDDVFYGDMFALGAASRAAREETDPQLKALAEHAVEIVVDKYKKD